MIKKAGKEQFRWPILISSHQSRLPTGLFLGKACSPTKGGLLDYIIYTHGNKLGNTCNNVTTNFGLYISFFVKIMKNVLTICQTLQSPKLLLCENG